MPVSLQKGSARRKSGAEWGEENQRTDHHLLKTHATHAHAHHLHAGHAHHARVKLLLHATERWLLLLRAGAIPLLLHLCLRPAGKPCRARRRRA